MDDSKPTEGFEQLLRPHMPRMYRLACRLTANKSDAEDLFQDVLTKVYVRLDDLALRDDPATWLNRVLYNHFIDNLRRYKRRRLLMVEESQLPGESMASLAGHQQPDSDAERFETLQKLGAALASLSDDHRRVILLHDSEGYKLEEIHELTGDPVGTLKSRLHRARARLRELLDDDGTFF